MHAVAVNYNNRTLNFFKIKLSRKSNSFKKSILQTKFKIFSSEKKSLKYLSVN